jgi:hypothetical protein
MEGIIIVELDFTIGNREVQSFFQNVRIRDLWAYIYIYYPDVYPHPSVTHDVRQTYHHRARSGTKFERLVDLARRHQCRIQLRPPVHFKWAGLRFGNQAACNTVFFNTEADKSTDDPRTSTVHLNTEAEE